MKRKTLTLIVALSLSAALVLTACGGGGNADSPAPAPAPAPAPSAPSGDTGAVEEISGTLTMALLATMEPGMKVLIENFNQVYPNVVCDFEFISDNQAYNTQIPTRFSGGNGTDLVYVLASSTPTGARRFVEAGFLMDLSDQPWVSSMFPDLKRFFTFDDQVYAKDFGMSALACLHYDKDFFAELGLSPPQTWDELLDACAKIKEAGRIPLAWGGGVPAINTNNMGAMSGSVVFSKHPNWFEDRLAGNTTFVDTPEWRIAFSQLKELIDLGYLSPGAASMKQADMVAEFADGRAAMMMTYGGTSALAKEQQPDLNPGLVTYPGLTAADTRQVLQASGAVGIWVNTKNEAAAKAFLEFWAQPEQQDMFAIAGNIISSNMANTGQLSPAYEGLAPLFQEGKTIPDLVARWPNATFSDNFGTSLQGLFTGQKTVDDCLVDADAAWDAPE